MRTPDGTLNQDDLKRYPGYLLARARYQAFRNYERHVGRPYDLKPVEFSILVLLQSNDDVSQVELAQAMGVAAPNMTGILHRLEARGLVERQRSESDKRKQFIVLTAQARSLLREAQAAGKGMDKEWLARLSRAEVAMLMELLDRLAGTQRP
jgi:DNA-binding MarR family transcriptional regulator